MTPLELRELNTLATTVAGFALAALGTIRRGFLGFTLIASGATLLMMGRHTSLMNALKEGLMPEDSRETGAIGAGTGRETSQRTARKSPKSEAEVPVRRAAAKDTKHVASETATVAQPIGAGAAASRA